MYAEVEIWTMTPVSTVKKFKQSYPRGKRGFIRRLTYAPFPFKTLQAYRMDGDPTYTSGPIYQELKPLKITDWQLLRQSADWLIETGCGRFDTRSYVIDDGSVYRYRIEFKTDNDRLMYILKFPELV